MTSICAVDGHLRPAYEQCAGRFLNEAMMDTNVPSVAGKSEVPGLEQKTPPEAKSSSSESSTSATGPRKRPHRSIEGGKELRCMDCGGFFGEIKLKGMIEESRFRCHRCKAWSHFSFSG